MTQPAFKEEMVNWSEEEFAKNGISPKTVDAIPGGNFEAFTDIEQATITIWGGKAMSYIYFQAVGFSFGFWIPMSISSGTSTGILVHAPDFKWSDVVYITMSVISGRVHIDFFNKQKKQIATFSATWPGSITDMFTISIQI